MDKYYTPEIEEFHVGFEYEVYDTLGDGHYDWFNDTYFKLNMTNHKGDGGNNVWTMETLAKAIKDEHVRVKHLDREDIESLGWEHYNGLIYRKPETPYELIINFKRRVKDSITIRELVGDKWFELAVFPAKNKSELKRILKQIGV